MMKADAQDATADHAAGLETFGRAEAALAARLRAQPDGAGALIRLAKVLFGRALTLDRTKRQAESLAVLEAAAAKAAEAARLTLDDPEVYFWAIRTAHRQAIEYAVRHRPDDALRSVNEAQAVLDRFRMLSKEPEQVLEFEADQLRTRAEIFELTGNRAELGEVRKRVVELRRDLLARRPSIVSRHSLHAVALLDLGSYLDDTGRPADALLAVREARQL